MRTKDYNLFELKIMLSVKTYMLNYKIISNRAGITSFEDRSSELYSYLSCSEDQSSELYNFLGCSEDSYNSINGQNPYSVFNRDEVVSNLSEDSFADFNNDKLDETLATASTTIETNNSNQI